ncbi:MAG: thioesterase family protein [Candidatus Nanopelagicus sp.]
MKAEQVMGAIGMANMTIRPGDTYVAQGVNDLPVVGSNQISALMESACSTAIIEFLDFGETTVTTNLQIQIQGAVGISHEIHATARCLGLDEGILQFEVEVHQSARLVASGFITRKFVERVSFMARVAAETMVAEKENQVSEKKIASSLNI